MRPEDRSGLAQAPLGGCRENQASHSISSQAACVVSSGGLGLPQRGCGPWSHFTQKLRGPRLQASLPPWPSPALPAQHPPSVLMSPQELPLPRVVRGKHSRSVSLETQFLHLPEGGHPLLLWSLLLLVGLSVGSVIGIPCPTPPKCPLRGTSCPSH